MNNKKETRVDRLGYYLFSFVRIVVKKVYEIRADFSTLPPNFAPEKNGGNWEISKVVLNYRPNE